MIPAAYVGIIGTLAAAITGGLGVLGPGAASLATAAGAASPVAVVGTTTAALGGAGAVGALGSGAAAAGANPHVAGGVNNAGAAMYNDAVGSVAGAVNDLNIPGIRINVN